MKNIKSLTISSKLPKEKAMNFQELVKQGQALIQNLSGKSGDWTNYNLSDPGITILEHVCYAITDLSYRISFPVEDLLALKKSSSEEYSRAEVLNPAKDILTNNPFTKNDYRKILIDLLGVKNAQFNIVKKVGIEEATPPTPPTEIKGLYRVVIEPKLSLERNTNIPKIAVSNIKNIVKAKLNQYRNLCEDVYEIIVLEPQLIKISVSIEIIDNTDIDQLKKHIAETIIKEISPQISFYSVEEMRSQGKSIEEIFDGPILEHGFIDDTELSNFSKKEKIYVADIIESIHKINGIKSIREFLVNHQEEMILVIDDDKTPFVKTIEVKLYNNGRDIEQGLLQTNKQEENKEKKKNTDWPLPSGRYRNLAEYTSIQEDFPHHYLLGEDSANSAIISNERKAVAKQLKGYLLIFDQILANYFAQTAHLNILFNSIEELKEKPDEGKYRTYFTQSVKCTEIKFLTGKGYKKELEKISNDSPENSRITRKNKLLDCLSAIFALKFADYPIFSDQYKNSTLSPEQKLINSKIDFLIHFLKYGGQRNKAINYDFIKDNKQKSALQLYIIDNVSEFLSGNNSWVEKFYMVEHILLRPLTGRQEDMDFLRKDGDIYSCQVSIILPYEMQKDEKTIKDITFSGAPAHIRFHYHWWEDQKIENFSKIYSKWQDSFSNDPSSEENLINSRVILNHLFYAKGIGAMVIRGEDSIPATDYYFTVSAGQKNK